MKLQKLSLFGAVAGALLLTAAFVPRANATVIVYFNFEDGILPKPPNQTGTVDTAADVIVANGGDNPGGGIFMSTLTINNTTSFKDSTGLTTNRTAGDIDNPTTVGQAVTLFSAGGNQGAEICFTANTTVLTNLSLSFAASSSGNAYTNVDLTINGTSTTLGVGQTLTTGGDQTITFDSGNSSINDAAGVGNVEFCLVFTGGQSNGANGQTVIDNIQLKADVVPEPATVVGGLLSVCTLCWHQRRRLIRSLCLRGA